MKRFILCSFSMPLLSGCGTGTLCSSETLHVARDLGSDRVAFTSVRNCGATSDFATVISVGRATEPQEAATEVFVADSDHGSALEGGGGAIWTSVVWSAPGKLSVVYASKARVFKQLLSAKEADIRFKASDPPVSPPVD